MVMHVIRCLFLRQLVNSLGWPLFNIKIIKEIRYLSMQVS